MDKDALARQPDAASQLRQIKYLVFGLLIAVLIAGGIVIGSHELDKSHARDARADQLLNCARQGVAAEDC